MKHFYRKIQGWGITKYGKLYSHMVSRAKNNSHFVEIGAWKGKSTAYMAVEIANSGKTIKFDTVDTWLGSEESTHHKDPAVISGTLYELFLENIRPARDHINPIRSTSVTAAKLYQDHSLDFVFIDASHRYENVRQDIEHWLPKVKSGGMIAGDDIRWASVRKAVKELLPEYENCGRWWQYHVD